MENDEDYQKQLDLFMKEEYQKTKPKPNGMFGHWGWYAKNKRIFDEQYKNEKIQIGRAHV